MVSMKLDITFNFCSFSNFEKSLKTPDKMENGGKITKLTPQLSVIESKFHRGAKEDTLSFL